jgi:hypothetical protein
MPQLSSFTRTCPSAHHCAPTLDFLPTSSSAQPSCAAAPPQERQACSWQHAADGSLHSSHCRHLHSPHLRSQASRQPAASPLWPAPSLSSPSSDPSPCPCPTPRSSASEAPAKSSTGWPRSAAATAARSKGRTRPVTAAAGNAAAAGASCSAASTSVAHAQQHTLIAE